MENNKTLVIGIDLHGTLLNDEWQVAPELMEDLVSIIDEVRDFCKVVICTGNHFEFVKNHVPEELRSHLDGAVIETGCAYADMDGNETSFVTPDEQHAIDELNLDIMAAQVDDELPDFKYFGKRKHSISVFTKDEEGGADPETNLLPVIKEIVAKSEYADKVTVTYSSVAVDIFPKGHHKATGMEKIADGGTTVGIADSMNDYGLIKLANMAFVPNNASQKLLEDLVKNDGKKIVRIDQVEDYHLSDPDVVIQATQNDTRSVIEILKFIRDRLNPNKE